MNTLYLIAFRYLSFCDPILYLSILGQVIPQFFIPYKGRFSSIFRRVNVTTRSLAFLYFQGSYLLIVEQPGYKLPLSSAPNLSVLIQFSLFCY